MNLFRAIWPITDRTRPYELLITEAEAEIPELILRAHARITNWPAGRWSIARSEHVPGSGRVTPMVLLFEAPAVELTPREYSGRLGWVRKDVA
jgi:hypothetical protein